MSASKKKMFRNQTEQGLTQKEIAEQQELAAAKKKEKTYWIIGIVVVILVAALLIWNSSFVQKRATALAIGDTKYSVVDVSYYYAQALSYEYQMAQYGLSGYDTSIDADLQIYDATTLSTYRDYFLEQAITSLTQVTAMVDAAEADGFTMSADGQAEIDAAFESIDELCATYGITRDSYLSQSYSEYMTESDFTRILEQAILADEYATAHQAEYTYDDAALLAYYEENADAMDSYDYRYFFISGSAPSTTDADGNTVSATDEETAAALAESIEKAAQAVADVETANDLEEAFITASIEYGTAVEGEDATLIEGNTGSDLSYSNYASWLMDGSRVAGDVTYVEGTYGCYVLLFLDRYLDESPTVDIRHILVMGELDQEDDETTEDIDESSIPSDAALATAKASVESIVAEWESGEKTADSFGVLAETYSEDTGSNTNGGAYTSVVQGQMFDAFDAWIFEDGRQSGDVTLIENPQSGQQGWHAVYYDGVGRAYWYSVADSALRSADQTAWNTEMLAGYEAVQGSALSTIG